MIRKGKGGVTTLTPVMNVVGGVSTDDGRGKVPDTKETAGKRSDCDMRTT